MRALPLAEPDELGVKDGELLGDSVTVTETVTSIESDADGDEVEVGDVVGEKDGEALSDALGVALTVDVLDGVTVTV